MALVFAFGVIVGAGAVRLWQKSKRDPTDYALYIELNFPDDTDNTKLKAYLQRKGIPCKRIIDYGETKKTLVLYSDYGPNIKRIFHHLKVMKN
jgi:Uma2 family endonuclease